MANEITANKEYKAADNVETDDVPQGGDTIDNSYATKGSDAIPVVKDEAPVEQPNDARNPDSDGALERDDKEAIDESNIIKGDRLRHAKPQGPGYEEPSDDEGLPGPEDGTSDARGTGVEGAYDNEVNAESKVVGGAA